MNDAGAAVVLMTEDRAQQLGAPVRARILSWGISGCDPEVMGIGPVPAVRKAMEKAGRSLDEVGVIELNEAFAAQALAVIRDLDLDPAKVNPNGGAVALGHPIAATGASSPPSACRRWSARATSSAWSRSASAAARASRCCWRTRRPGSQPGMKLLVLAPHAVDAQAVRSALPGEDLEGAEVLVVAPAMQHSGLRFWMSDSDEAIEQAEGAAAQTGAALQGEAASVRTTTGESEPLLALQDALATFPADRIVVFRGDEDDYREEELAEAESRLGVPVTTV